MSFRAHHAISLLWLVRGLILVVCLLFIAGASAFVQSPAFGDAGHNLASNAAVAPELERSQRPTSPPAPLPAGNRGIFDLQGEGSADLIAYPPPPDGAGGCFSDLTPGPFPKGKGSVRATPCAFSLSLRSRDLRPKGKGRAHLTPGASPEGKGSAGLTPGPISVSLDSLASLKGSLNSGDLVPDKEGEGDAPLLANERTDGTLLLGAGNSPAGTLTFRTFLPLVSLYNTGVIPSKPTRVVIGAHATKISQLVGDYDRERQAPTANLTETRYQLVSTDLGVPFYHKGRIYLLFGDSFGGNGGDAIAYTTDFNPENGLNLNFIQDASGVYQPIVIPGISQGAFEVPMEGVSVNGRMYTYHTTDSSSGPSGDTMGRSVVAVSDDDGRSFAYQYDLSRQYFINVSIVQAEAAQWPGLPLAAGPGLVMFGSGAYRQSNVYLAFQPESQINTRASIRFFAGLDSGGKPTWSTSEGSAKALFNQPCVGELSVSYNTFIGKWIMLYNCALSQTRGINMRWADEPWGPWSEPQILFRPWEDNGYCHFMHTSWTFEKCDNVQDPERENEWGGEYGPYQFETLATGNDTSTTIYFSMSTWNPYTVVLMKARLVVE